MTEAKSSLRLVNATEETLPSPQVKWGKGFPEVLKDLEKGVEQVETIRLLHP